MGLSEKELRKMRNRYSAVGGPKKPGSVDLSYDAWADAMVKREVLGIKLREYEGYLDKLRLMLYHINGVLAMEEVLKNTIPPEVVEEIPKEAPDETK